MHPKSLLIASLTPTDHSGWLPPLRFRVSGFLKLSKMIDDGLADLEARTPKKRTTLTMTMRNHHLLKKRPR